MNALILAQDLPELPVYGFEPSLGSLLSLVITVLLPVLVGLLTKASWSGGVKAVLLLLLASVNALVTSALEAANTGVELHIIPVIYTIFINFIIAVAVHFGLWKPTGVAASAQSAMISDGSSAESRDQYRRHR